MTSKTHNRQPIFEDFWLGRTLVKEMKKTNDSGLVCSLAWVIMPDHFHWLFELKQGTLDGLVRRVKSRSAIAINKQRGTDGRFWQTGFHDTAFRHDENLHQFARYIVANPLRAGMVDRVSDYPLWDAVWI